MRMGNRALRMNLLTWTLLNGEWHSLEHAKTAGKASSARVAYPPTYSKEPPWSPISEADSELSIPMKSSVRYRSARSSP